MSEEVQQNLETLQTIPSVKIGAFEYYLIADLAAAFKVPAAHFKRKVRLGAFGGQKIGKAYVVSAEEFNEWVKNGSFEYKARPRRSAIQT